MRLINDLDNIYSKGLVFRDNGEIFCSVCKKIYKQKSFAVKHYAKQDCYKMYHIFKDTVTEKFFYKLYKRFNVAQNIQIMTFIRFRKSRMYTPIANFYVFCIENNVSRMADYFEYTVNENCYENLIVCMIKACKESNLRNYRKVAYQFLDGTKDEKFFNENETLLKDEVFAIRSIERGDISIEKFFNENNFEDFVEGLTPPLYDRLEVSIGRVNEY